MEDPSVYRNPSFLDTSRSLQRSHENEADGSSGPESSYEQCGTSGYNNSRLVGNKNIKVKIDGKIFSYIVLCAIILLVLISVATLALSLWNTFKLQSSTTEGASNFRILEHKVQNLSSGLQTSSNDISKDLTDLNDSISIILSTLQQFISYPRVSVPECGSGIWRRLIYLNMRDPSQRCPPAWREYNNTTSESKRVRSCGLPDGYTPSCVSSMLSAQGTRYRRVCGKIIGYQHGIVNAFLYNRSIDDKYVEGISVTHGNPRTHIWTFAASAFDCPCARSHIVPPSFVGDNYFCESGTTTTVSSGTFYLDDPLWDGEGCFNGCCKVNSPPWFNATLPSSTTDDIEVRICGGRYFFYTTRDTPIELIEIYVQ